MPLVSTTPAANLLLVSTTQVENLPPESMTLVVNIAPLLLVSLITLANLPPVSTISDTGGKYVMGIISDLIPLSELEEKKCIYMLTLLSKGVKTKY